MPGRCAALTPRIQVVEPLSKYACNKRYRWQFATRSSGSADRPGQLGLAEAVVAALDDDRLGHAAGSRSRSTRTIVWSMGPPDPRCRESRAPAAGRAARARSARAARARHRDRDGHRSIGARVIEAHQIGRRVKSTTPRTGRGEVNAANSASCAPADSPVTSGRSPGSRGPRRGRAPHPRSRGPGRAGSRRSRRRNRARGSAGTRDRPSPRGCPRSSRRHGTRRRPAGRARATAVA